MIRAREASLIGLLLSAIACGAPDTSGSIEQGSSVHPPGLGASPPAAGGPYAGPDAGHLAIRLAAAPTNEVTSMVVTVASVEAFVSSRWITLVDRQQTVDLLTLQGGRFLELGTASLPPGRVGQLRLRLAVNGDNHVVTPDGAVHALAIPSADASGIKLASDFDVPACATGHISIEFDSKRSLDSGSHGKTEAEWTMSPVVTLNAAVTEGPCE
jgi:hypothetical protein